MKYFYVSHRTKDTFIKDIKEKPNYDILSTYKRIKKKNNNHWGIFLFDENILPILYIYIYNNLKILITKHINK